ncbi:cell division ATP-binding protein FtsE [Guggenheimella bovis]
MVVFKNVTMRYPTGNVALDDVSLQIKPGEFVFLIGPSGAGKSTMIRLLSKEIHPTDGQIFVNGKNVTNLHKRLIPHYRREIGIVFQDYKLLNKLNVYDNVAFAMDITGRSRRHIKKTVPLLLNLVGLGGKEKVFPLEMSGGEQQRVSIARALANNPSLLICDEPTGNLDPETSWGLMDLLDKLNTYGTTIIMATHERDLVDAMKKRVIELEAGKIVRDEKRGGYR